MVWMEKNKITVSAPNRIAHLSIKVATRAGTCLDAVASALKARAGLRAAAAAAAAAFDTGAHSKLGPTQTAKFDDDIMFCEALAAMCIKTQRK